jgi:hypothetical protein
LPQIANLLSPHFSVIAHIFYAMDLFCMLFANIYHYAGRSDSLGIINLPAKKVGQRSRHFFPQPDFKQESSRPLF